MPFEKCWITMRAFEALSLCSLSFFSVVIHGHDLLVEHRPRISVIRFWSLVMHLYIPKLRVYDRFLTMYSLDLVKRHLNDRKVDTVLDCMEEMIPRSTKCKVDRCISNAAI